MPSTTFGGMFRQDFPIKGPSKVFNRNTKIIEHFNSKIFVLTPTWENIWDFRLETVLPWESYQGWESCQLETGHGVETGLVVTSEGMF
jgi:hypothetical protein